MVDVDDTVMTAAEVAAYLRISVRHLRRLRNDGDGPPFHKVGQRITYLQTEVTEWVRRNPQEGDR